MLTWPQRRPSARGSTSRPWTSSRRPTIHPRDLPDPPFRPPGAWSGAQARQPIERRPTQPDVTAPVEEPSPTRTDAGFLVPYLTNSRLSRRPDACRLFYKLHILLLQCASVERILSWTRDDRGSDHPMDLLSAS